jgi:hypothetical protein
LARKKNTNSLQNILEYKIKVARYVKLKKQKKYNFWFLTRRNHSFANKYAFAQKPSRHIETRHMGSTSISGQSRGDIHSIDVGMTSNAYIRQSTSSVIKNRKANKIIARINLRVLAIFFSFWI